jgi:hypothetical protein
MFKQQSKNVCWVQEGPGPNTSPWALKAWPRVGSLQRAPQCQSSPCSLLSAPPQPPLPAPASLPDLPRPCGHGHPSAKLCLRACLLPRGLSPGLLRERSESCDPKCSGLGMGGPPAPPQSWPKPMVSLPAVILVLSLSLCLFLSPSPLPFSSLFPFTYCEV